MVAESVEVSVVTYEKLHCRVFLRGCYWCRYTWWQKVSANLLLFKVRCLSLGVTDLWQSHSFLCFLKTFPGMGTYKGLNPLQFLPQDEAWKEHFDSNWILVWLLKYEWAVHQGESFFGLSWYFWRCFLLGIATSQAAHVQQITMYVVYFFTSNNMFTIPVSNL